MFFHQNITFAAFYFQTEMFMLITMPRSIIDRIPNLDLEMEQFYDIVTEFARFNSSYILCIKANECYALLHQK